MTLEELNDKFVYKTDKDQFRVEELWTGLQDVNGKLVGDCEDYAITLKKEVEEFKDWNYYWCRLDGEGHCILSNGKCMIDNNTKEVWTLDKFEKTWTITELRPYKWYELLYKFAQAKVYKTWFKLTK